VKRRLSGRARLPPAALCFFTNSGQSAHLPINLI